MRKSNANSKVRSNRLVSRQDVPLEIGQMSKRSRLDSLLGKVFNDLFRGRNRKPQRPSFALEVLEPRLLLSADPVFALNSNTGALTRTCIRGGNLVELLNDRFPRHRTRMKPLIILSRLFEHAPVL